MTGLFATFNISKRGLNAAQSTINVTSHNISNANTDGYSRQRAELVPSRPMSVIGAAGQYGTGAEVDAIRRIRDTFVDYQWRNENSTLSKNQVRSNFLYEVESIFNEPSDTGLSTMMSNFFDSFQELSKNPSSSNTRTVAVQKASTLADAINSTYKKVDELKKNAQSELQKNVKDINTTLEQINEINKQIRQISVQGQEPNDLLDRRDNLIDTLSDKFGINIVRDDYNGVNISPVDSTRMVYPNVINSDPNTQGARFSYISSISKEPNATKNADGTYTYEIKYNKLGNVTEGDKEGTINVNMTEEQAKELDANRVIWADTNGQLVGADGYPIKDGKTIDYSELMTFVPQNGEISGNITVQADVIEYKNQLNQMAKALAFSVNSIHSGTTDATKDNRPLFVNKDLAHYNDDGTLDAVSYHIIENGYDKAESLINASNISINKEILLDPMKLNANTIISSNGVPNPSDPDATDSGEGDGKRALAIAQVRDMLVKIQKCDSSLLSRDGLITFEDGAQNGNTNLKIEQDVSGMTVLDYYKDIIDKLGVQAQEANRLTANQKSMLEEFENTRASISGVSLDEEMANLIAYQHAYTANAKVISTVDELLDVVINGLKK